MRLVILVLISALLTLTPSANADVLATKTTSFNLGTTSTSPQRVGLRLSCTSVDYLLAPKPSSASDTMILEDALFSTADVGKTYTATAANDPHFAAFAANMTNGQLNWMLHQSLLVGDDQISQVSSAWSAESWWLSSAKSNDFAGYELTGVTVRLMALQGKYEGTFKVTFEGTPVPEPGAMTTLTASLLLLARNRRCR